MANQPLPSDKHIQRRYLRQIQLPGFGEAGQQSLGEARVLIVGLGGLGCAVAQYLTAAGVGNITLLDGDDIALSNLQRQILFDEASIGANKADVAKQKLQQLNSQVQITAIDRHLDLPLAETLIASADLILDCTDNFTTRYLINDVAHFYKKNWVYASVLGFAGQVASFNTRLSCFRCLYPNVSEVPNCNQAGVLGVLPGIVGNLQALMAIQMLCCEQTCNQLVRFSGNDYSLQTIGLAKSRQCLICSGQQEYFQLHSHRCDESAQPRAITASQIKTFIEQHPNAKLADIRSPAEYQEHNAGGINIPLSDFESWFAGQVSQPLILLCQTGKRCQWLLGRLPASSTARSPVVYLEGGLDALTHPTHSLHLLKAL
ncbi:ThiF family adenylyltransferase [Halioxenophilus aromaticivorans]|uniref:Molybdopterin-synthase adenylyltransferase MoeB n=1 Tax=Halioxenophilus aromaticivorans TaxID=1306992 RepID=A0AAV3U2R9_9ALTE